MGARSLSVEPGPGASLCVCTVAPIPSKPAECSKLDYHAAGGYLYTEGNIPKIGNNEYHREAYRRALTGCRYAEEVKRAEIEA
eukprot:384911-Rhodomonas_salina.1